MCKILIINVYAWHCFLRNICEVTEMATVEDEEHDIGIPNNEDPLEIIP